MARAGPKRVGKYTLEFKRDAVRLSLEKGVQVQTVAEALDIHPIMLSRWRQEFRAGQLGPKELTAPRRATQVRELRRLQELEKAHAQLLEEHELLKKAVRFWSALQRKRLLSSKGNTARLR
jgi:transposase